MAACTHYFAFKRQSNFHGYWVEIQSDSECKARRLMTETYGLLWDKYYFCTYSASYIQQKFPKGVLAKYEID